MASRWEMFVPAGSGMATDVSLVNSAVRKLGAADGTPRDLDGDRGPRPRVVACGFVEPETLAKNGSSSAMDPRRRGREPPRDSTSSREIWTCAMAACRSRSARNSSSRPSTVRTSQRSGAPSVCGRRTLNWLPQVVHLTVVPRSDTSASSNSYAVLQRSQVTSIGLLTFVGPGARRAACQPLA